METVKFTELDIRPEILKAVANMGFEARLLIQQFLHVRLKFRRYSVYRESQKRFLMAIM